MLVNPRKALSPQDRWMGLTAVIIAAFLVGLSFGMGYPVSALKLTASGSAEWVVGIIGAAPSLAVLMILPFVPQLVRRYGVIATFASGSLTAAAGYAVLAIVDSALAWIAVRFLMGAGIAVSWLVSQTWVAVVSDEVTRGRALALYVMAFSSGMAVCPALIDWLDVSGPLPLAAGVVASVLSIVPVVLVARLAPDVDAEDAGAGNVFQALFWAPVAMAGAFMSGFIELVHLSLLTNAGLASGLDQSAVLQLLTFFLVGALSLQLAFGWLADNLPPAVLTIALMTIVSFTCLLLPTTLSDPVLGAAVVFAIGGLIYGLYTVALAIIGELNDQHDAGASNAAFIMCYQAGGIFGPAIAGATMTVQPVAGFVGTQFVAGILAAIAMYRLNSKSC